MKVTMRDISTKKHGTMTQVVINKKSTYCDRNIFLTVMNNFITKCRKTNYFVQIPESSINYKYYTHMDIGNTELLFMRFNKALKLFKQKCIKENEIFDRFIKPYLKMR